MLLPFVAYHAITVRIYRNFATIDFSLFYLNYDLSLFCTPRFAIAQLS